MDVEIANNPAAQLLALTRQLQEPTEAARSAAFEKILDLANQGSADAMFHVARCLRYAQGVPQDTAAADAWLDKACVAPEPSVHALYTVGVEHLRGKRPAPNIEHGLNLLMAACRMGLPKAITEMASVLEHGTALTAPDHKAAYRILAEAFSDRPAPIVVKAYVDFVERHQTIARFLNS